MAKPVATRVLCVSLLAAIAAACSVGDPAEPVLAKVTSTEILPAGSGRTIYENRVEGANTFTCATCHALSEPTSDGWRRPGHPIGDATRRPSFKNGAVPRFLDAVNSCLTEWMNAQPWTATDARFLALHDWLDERATSMGMPAVAPALTHQRVDPPLMVSGGDRARGNAIFNGSCIVCHGENATGTERAPNITALGTDPKSDGTPRGVYIADRVRRSGRIDSKVYPGLTGGQMPFWAADRLSDMELVDIIAFLEPTTPPPPPPAPGGTFDMTTRSCGKTHARVGQTAVLVRHIHGTSGKAAILDDCTVEVTDFAFDGGGIDVRVYGGFFGSFQQGFAMGNDLRRSGGYLNATVRVNLPLNKTLNDLNGIAIWCVPAGANFADGLLQ